MYLIFFEFTSLDVCDVSVGWTPLHPSTSHEKWEGAEREGRAREGASGAGTGDTCVWPLLSGRGMVGMGEGLTGSLAACMHANVQNQKFSS